jgi:hypothetical protein
MTQLDAAAALTRYIELVGSHDLGRLDDLFADSLVATTAGNTFDKPQWIAALRRLLPVVVRNDIRHVFRDGNKACVIYDFVTDTEAGAVPCVESVTVVDGRITAIELIFEKVNWAYVASALQARALAT